MISIDFIVTFWITGHRFFLLVIVPIRILVISFTYQKVLVLGDISDIKNFETALVRLISDLFFFINISGNFISDSNNFEKCL